MELFEDGQHPLWDRDEVQDVYAEWRAVFNEYDPPRTAVAEAWVAPHRQARYSSPDGLGQTFNFDLLQADFDVDQFRAVITKNLAEAAATGAVQGVTESGAKDIKVVGFDSGKTQLEAIRDGRMAGAITQSPVKMGYETVVSAIKAIDGQELPKVTDSGFA